MVLLEDIILETAFLIVVCETFFWLLGKNPPVLFLLNSFVVIWFLELGIAAKLNSRILGVLRPTRVSPWLWETIEHFFNSLPLIKLWYAWLQIPVKRGHNLIKLF